MNILIKKGQTSFVLMHVQIEGELDRRPDRIQMW